MEVSNLLLNILRDNANCNAYFILYMISNFIHFQVCISSWIRKSLLNIFHKNILINKSKNHYFDFMICAYVFKNSYYKNISMVSTVIIIAFECLSMRWCCEDDDDDIANNSTQDNDVIEFYYLYWSKIFHNPAAHWKMSNKNFLPYHPNNLIGTSWRMRRRITIKQIFQHS